MNTWSKNIDASVAAQLQNYFAKAKNQVASFVTISREFGCDGEALANTLVSHLNHKGPGSEWFYLNRTKMLEASQDLTEETLGQLEEFGHSEFQGYLREALFGMGSQMETVRKIAKITRLFASRGRVVLLGAGAPIVTRGLSHGVHVRLYAPFEWRVRNYARRQGLSEQQSLAVVTEKHDAREAFVKTYMGAELSDPTHFDLCVNNSTLSLDLIAEMVHSLLLSRG